MQPPHDAAHARPLADRINRYAADLLASAPGMLPLEAVRQAMEATAGVDEGDEHLPSSSALHLPAGRGDVS